MWRALAREMVRVFRTSLRPSSVRLVRGLEREAFQLDNLEQLPVLGGDGRRVHVTGVGQEVGLRLFPGRQSFHWW